jgi:hypothetical protein
MGALTSKPYSFKARPWEVQKNNAVDFFDVIGLRVFVETVGNSVFRVIKDLNFFDFFWLTDKARFFFDSLILNRLLSPIFAIPALNYQYNIFMFVDWLVVYDLFFFLQTLLFFVLVDIKFFFYNNNIRSFFSRKYVHGLNFFVSENFDLLSGRSLLALDVAIGGCCFFNNYSSFFYRDFDILDSYYLDEDYFKSVDTLVLYNCNLRVELPNFYFYFLKKMRSGCLKVFSFGSLFQSSLITRVNHIFSVFTFFKVRDFSYFKQSVNYFRSSKLLVITGILFNERYDLFSQLCFFRRFFNLLNSSARFLRLSKDVSFYSNLSFGLLSGWKEFSFLERRLYLNLNFYTNVDSNIVYSLSDFNVYVGSNLPKSVFDVYLPIEFAYERKQVFQNLFCVSSVSDFIVTPEGANNSEVRSFFDVVNAVDNAAPFFKFCNYFLSLFFKLRFSVNFLIKFYFRFSMQLVYVYILLFRLFCIFFFSQLKYNEKSEEFFFLPYFLYNSGFISVSKYLVVFSLVNEYVFDYFCMEQATKSSLILSAVKRAAAVSQEHVGFFNFLK